MKEYQAFTLRVMNEADMTWLTKRLNGLASEGFEVIDFQYTKDAGNIEYANVLMERDVPQEASDED